MKPVLRGLIALLALSPLFFGTVEVWSLSLMKMGCFGLIGCWFLGKMGREEGRFTIVNPPFLVPIGILMGIAVFQLIPLPGQALRIVSPQTYRIYQQVLGDGFSWGTISVCPHASLQEILRLGAYLCVYILSFQILRDKEAILRTSLAVVITGSVFALIGILQMILWNGKLLWVREMSQGGTPFGPYVNRNHFAGLMEMVVPVSIGMLIFRLPYLRTEGGVKGFFREFLTHREMNRLVLTIAGVVIMITALFLSMSRGGIIGLSISMVFFGILLVARRSTRGKGWVIIAISCIVLFTVGWFGWKPILDRFEKLTEASLTEAYRIHTWKDSLMMIKEFPVFGTGLGTFEQVYPAYKSIPAQGLWDHAHNDFLEAGVELGVAGLSVIFFTIGAFYTRMLAILRQRRSLTPRLLGIGGMVGVTAILIHSFTDFNLHIGANGLYFSFVLAFSLIAAHARMKDEGNGTLLDTREIAIPLDKAKALRTATIIGVAALSVVPLMSIISEILFTAAGGVPAEGRTAPSLSRALLAKGAFISPLDSRFPFALGSGGPLNGAAADTVRYLSRAVERNPVNSGYLQGLGFAYDMAGDSALAERYVRLGVDYHPTSAWNRKNLALWLFRGGRKGEALLEMKRAIALDPENTRRYITSLALHGVSADEIRSALPERPDTLIHYGRYEEERGNVDEALEIYLQAISAMRAEGKFRPGLYSSIGNSLEKRGMVDQALALYEEGVGKAPGDVGLRIRLAMLYDRLKMEHRARREYEIILGISPGNQHAQKRLKALRAVDGATP